MNTTTTKIAGEDMTDAVSLTEVLRIIETYEVSVGNSAAGEIACEMTMANLRDIRDAITALHTAPAQSCGDAEQADEAVTRDAERYRHFRQGKSLTVRVPVKDKEVIYYLGHKPEAAFPEAFDAAIDAARAKDSK